MKSLYERTIRVQPLKTIKLPVSNAEWRSFRIACVKNGETMTKVLMRAIREYIAKGKEGGR